MSLFFKTLIVCVVSLLVAGIGMRRKMWQRPWFPLLAFCLIVPIEWYYDWSFIRHHNNEIVGEKFEWENPKRDTDAAVKDMTARIIIETVEFLRLITVVWVFGVSLFVAMESWSNAPYRHRIVLIFAAIGAMFIYGVFWEEEWFHLPNPWTNQTLFAELANHVRLKIGPADFAQPIWLQVVRATHFALIFAACAIGLVMAKPGEDIPALQTQSKYLTHLLYACAALCVMHVVGMGLWYLREAALLVKPTEAELVRRLCGIISAGNGVSYVCILIAFHLPAVDVLATQARKIKRFCGFTSTEHEQEEWLAKNGLISTWPQFYMRIAMVLSPLLAGFPSTKLLGLIFG